MSFRVAIIGRPNVGKSTLFNRLVGKKLALVDDRPGVTRDRREGEARLGDLRFTIIDTAGLDEEGGADRIDQIEPALHAGATRLLLDNMAPAMLRQALALVGGRVPCEASGGVRLDTIAAIAATGVDFISVGRLTQSAPAADIGLDFTPL